MQVGVFIPINNNGWITSTTSPQYPPSFADKTSAPDATANRQKLQCDHYLTNHGVFVGSYAKVAALLDEIPGLAGVMLTFDDFVIGMDQFGTRIQPRIKGRARVLESA